MVNPGSFRGIRKEFLLGEKPTYSVAVIGGCARDTLANIQRRFLKRFPIDLSDSVDPTPEVLAAIDDDTPDEEYEAPDQEKMTVDEFSEATRVIEDRQRRIQFRKDVSDVVILCLSKFATPEQQIKRWMAYQYMKDQELDPRKTGAHNPYNVLLSQLTGGTSGKPRQKTAMNIWRRTVSDEIEAKHRRRALEGGVARKQLAALREAIAKEMFSKLDTPEREEWRL
jgi:hypothetical protein